MEKAKQVEYVLSDHQDVCLSLSACLEAKKPYHGMYIKNGKVMLANLVEKIEIKDKVYKLAFLSTSVQNVACEEYITTIDLENNKFEYDIGSVAYTKQLAFKEQGELLGISYHMVNKEDKSVKFKIIPMVTYRDLYSMKTSNMLRFNQREIAQGTVISLSVMDQANIIMKSEELDWTREQKNVTNVKHELVGKDGVKEVFTEDLVIPGEFEIMLKAKEEKDFVLWVGSNDFSLSDLSIREVQKEAMIHKEKVSFKIDENYVELQDLAKSMDSLYLKKYLIPSLPYRRGFDAEYDLLVSQENINSILKDIQDLINIVKAIDGAYLTFGKVIEAREALLHIKRYIKALDTIQEEKARVQKELVLLKLWYVESVNRLIQQDNTVDLFLDFVKDIVYFMLSDENSEKYLRDIETVALTYNAVRVYESLLNKVGLEDVLTYKGAMVVQNLIEEKFWCEDKRVMRKQIDDMNPVASIEMIYTLSLSYPCIVGNMPVKVLDTIFKELYTPYGLREVSKNSIQNTGLIYPKYMAHFVKANLRQNGVTRASQKIAYNLVKELIQDIGKYTNAGIKEVYHEKGILIDSIGYDLLTNAEVIRLYDMLT